MSIATPWGFARTRWTGNLRARDSGIRSFNSGSPKTTFWLGGGGNRSTSESPNTSETARGAGKSRSANSPPSRGKVRRSSFFPNEWNRTTRMLGRVPETVGSSVKTKPLPIFLPWLRIPRSFPLPTPTCPDGKNPSIWAEPAETLARSGATNNAPSHFQHPALRLAAPRHRAADPGHLGFRSGPQRLGHGHGQDSHGCGHDVLSPRPPRGAGSQGHALQVARHADRVRRPAACRRDVGEGTARARRAAGVALPHALRLPDRERDARSVHLLRTRPPLRQVAGFRVRHLVGEPRQADRHLHPEGRGGQPAAHAAARNPLRQQRAGAAQVEAEAAHRPRGEVDAPARRGHHPR